MSGGPLVLDHRTPSTKKAQSLIFSGWGPQWTFVSPIIDWDIRPHFCHQHCFQARVSYPVDIHGSSVYRESLSQRRGVGTLCVDCEHLWGCFPRESCSGRSLEGGPAFCIWVDSVFLFIEWGRPSEVPVALSLLLASPVFLSSPILLWNNSALLKSRI